MSPEIRALALFAAWFMWLLPVILQRLRLRGAKQASRIDPRARWGIGLEMAGYFLVWTHSPQVWASDIKVWRAAAGFVFFHSKL